MRGVMLVSILFGAIVGCGSNDKSTADQTQAVSQAKLFLKSALGTDTQDVSTVQDEGWPGAASDLWRVEVETSQGHRCIYMNRNPDGSFDLMTVKSGVGCGTALLYDASRGGIQTSTGPEDASTIPELTSTVGKQNEIDQWNSYTPDEQQAYADAFSLCNGWADVNSPTFDVSAKKAAAYVEAHFNSSAEDGCRDGVAGLPLAGSGIPVPP
jgi:hypothetical protein